MRKVVITIIAIVVAFSLVGCNKLIPDVMPQKSKEIINCLGKDKQEIIAVLGSEKENPDLTLFPEFFYQPSESIKVGGEDFNVGVNFDQEGKVLNVDFIRIYPDELSEDGYNLTKFIYNALIQSYQLDLVSYIDIAKMPTWKEIQAEGEAFFKDMGRHKSFVYAHSWKLDDENVMALELYLRNDDEKVGTCVTFQIGAKGDRASKGIIETVDDEITEEYSQPLK